MAGIFITYRRKESRPHARLIFQDLRKRYRRGRVFMDVDGLKPGENFRDKIGRQLEGCTVLLALIGPQWAQVRDEQGALRLHDERDFVRMEIATALQRGITVIPVLIEGARMPPAAGLPVDLHPMLDLHAFTLDLDQHFDSGMDSLAAAIRPYMPMDLGGVPGWVRYVAPVVLLGVGGGYWWLNASPRPDKPPVAPTQVTVPQPVITASPAQPEPEPDPYPPGKRFRDCEDAACPWMVVVPAGGVMMGSPANELGRYDDEGPQHRVSISKFAMGQYEVTQGQWKALMGSNPSHFKDCGDECPVEKVSWNDVQEFVKKLNAKTGKTYRLPSEAEWEYAARAGTTTAYSFGATLSASKANCGEGAPGKTVAVGRYAANNFGLSDMHGNVYEWTGDWYAPYQAGEVKDPVVHQDKKESRRRVLRGGGWIHLGRDCRSATRNASVPDARNFDFGFRLARGLAG